MCLSYPILAIFLGSLAMIFLPWNSQAWAAIATAGAAIFAAWNAWEARRTADISQRQHELTARPYLTFGDAKIEVFPTDAEQKMTQIIKIGFTQKNVGHVPLYGTVKEIKFNGDVIEHPAKAYTIFPGCECYTWTKDLKIADTSVAVINIICEASIEIEYWPLNNPSKKYMRKRVSQIDTKSGKEKFIEDFAT